MADRPPVRWHLPTFVKTMRALLGILDPAEVDRSVFYGLADGETQAIERGKFAGEDWKREYVVYGLLIRFVMRADGWRPEPEGRGYTRLDGAHIDGGCSSHWVRLPREPGEPRERRLEIQRYDGDIDGPHVRRAVFRLMVMASAERPIWRGR